MKSSPLRTALLVYEPKPISRTAGTSIISPLTQYLTFRDGVNNWLEGSKHVSYGSGRYDDGSECPSTHPKRIMGRKSDCLLQGLS
jgi:hypothetical protein